MGAAANGRYVSDAGRYVSDAGRYVSDASRYVSDAGRYIRYRLLGLLVAALLSAMTGCIATWRSDLWLEPHVRRPDRSVVLFLVDGMDRGRFEELLGKGELPNIEERFVRGGVGVEYAVTSMPALTYPNAVSFVTGRFPGRHGILGNRWFDRHQRFYQDYLTAATYLLCNQDFLTPTLFEILPDHFTVNIQGHTRRGVRDTFDAPIESGLAWLFQTYACLDDYVGVRFVSVVDLANRVGEWPSVLMLYFPGVDEVGHLQGPDSERYAEALRIIDRAVGRVAGAMDRMGLSESTYFVLTTDHGHLPGHRDRVFDVAGWLESERGLRTYDGLAVPGFFDARFAFFEKHDAVVINGSYRRAAIHLKGREGWSSLPTCEEKRRVMGLPSEDSVAAEAASQPESTALYGYPAVELACFQEEPGRVRVVSRNGSALIERREDGPEPLYRVADAVGALPDGGEVGDPLGYSADPALAEFTKRGWHSSREWLEATAAANYPDFVPQGVEMFESHRAGDIVLFAAHDWAFGHYEPGGHGSCLAEEMRVPMFFAGGGLPRGASIRHARLVDVMPTVLEMLGETERLAGIGRIDGVSILAELRAAPPLQPGDAAAGAGADQLPPEASVYLERVAVSAQSPAPRPAGVSPDVRRERSGERPRQATATATRSRGATSERPGPGRRVPRDSQ